MKARKTVEDLRNVYNKIAPLFSSTREYLWDDLKPLTQFVNKGDSVVDIGCGNGRLYQLVEPFGASYIGVDQSEGLIDCAKERFPDVRFFVSEMTKTRLQDSIADVVFSIAAFHHLPTVEQRILGLKEMRRLLKANGKIVMINWNLYSDWARGKGFTANEHGDFYIPWKIGSGENLGDRYYHGFLFEELHELAEEAGLKIILQYYTRKGEVSSIGPGDNILTVLERI